MAGVEVEDLGDTDSEYEWDHEEYLFPKLPVFYGNRDSRNEVSWDSYKFEVELLLEESAYGRGVIKTAIINSLKGDAYDLVRRCGVGAEIDHILHVLDCAFCNVETERDILGRFYTTKQREGESVADFCNRVEEIFNLGVIKGCLKRTDQEILRKTMAEGLRSDIKRRAHYQVEKATYYEDLKLELRRIEKEMNTEAEQSKSTTTDTETPEVQQLIDRIEELENNKHPSFRLGRKFYRPSRPIPNNQRYYQPRRPVSSLQFQPVCYNCNKRGHIARFCRQVPSHSVTVNTNRREPQMVGETNEVDLIVENVRTRALLDTGSVVSLISKRFYADHLQHHPIRPVTQILNIECADGEQLPYEGCIAVDFDIPSGVPGTTAQTGLFLITKDTSFSEKTPIILGTNTLGIIQQDIKQKHGSKYLTTLGLHVPWYLTFRTIDIRDRELEKNNHRVAVVRCAVAERTIIRPNESIYLEAYTDKELNIPSTPALIQESELSNLPTDIDIAPGMIQFEYGRTKNFTVNLSNLTTNTIVIQPKAIIAEIQPVTIEENQEADKDDTTAEVLKTIHIDDGNKLTPKQREDIDKLLRKHQDIFSVDDTDIGHCTRIKHRIDLLPEFSTPFRQPHRRITPDMVNEVRKHLQQLLDAGIIRKSKSPWSSPVVLVRKKNGKLRMCVDYRMLNNRSVKDAYALPRIEEVFDNLSGSRFFSTIDMKAGYHQVEVEDEHKERTAFTVGPLGFYEYVAMPFGLSNSPATYQRLMEECLGEYNMTICVIYLDDLIIYSKDFESHLENIDKILMRLKENNLKLSPEKCFFIEEKVHFLGHVVGPNGIETDPEKVAKIKNWPTPKSPDELRSFLAFAGYYRRFIKDFSKITRPLSELLPPTTPKKSKQRQKHKKEWKWTGETQYIFEHLKEILSQPPILAYPDFSQEFELHTDASSKGLGAVLYQEQEGEKRVIAYASRALSKSEKNYPAHKLEYLALKWAVTEKFSDYLKLKRFTVLTDNNPLTYVLSSAKLDATGQRWASALGQYNFSIQYRCGKSNIDADALSRYPFEELQDNTDKQIKIDDTTVKAICGFIQQPCCVTLPCLNINITEVFEEPGQTLARKELFEIRKQQRIYPIIDRWRKATIDQTIPTDTRGKDDSTMKRHYKNLVIKRGILYKVTEEDNERKEQLILPKTYRQEVLKGLHDDIGHPGKERTLNLIRQRYYWPGMSKDDEDWVGQCERCLRRKTSTHSRAPLINIETTYPLEMVCMDFLTLETSKGGFSNILVITDHFTKLAVAVPTRNQTAKTTAEAFYTNFILNYGIPVTVHSDQGANFESEIIKELCTIMNINKSRTTPYHPMGNGITERFNRTLLDMLGTLQPDQKADWKKYVGPLVYAYNCTPHETTKTSPFELMFGRRPRLPIDSVFDLDLDQKSKEAKDYVKDMKERMKKTRDTIQQHIVKQQQKQKNQYDKRAKAVKLEVGDSVLVKILAFEGKHKIQDKFEKDTYIIIEQPNQDIPVFKVRSPSGHIKTLHRNHLFRVDCTRDVDKVDDPDKTTKRKTVKGKYPKDKEDPPLEPSTTREETVDEESDSDEENLDVPPTCNRGDAHGEESSATDEKEEVVEIEEDIDEPTDDTRDHQGSEVEEVEEEMSEDDEADDRVEETEENENLEDSGDGLEEEVREEPAEDNNREDRDAREEEFRRSGRSRRPPDRFRDYHMFRATEDPDKDRLQSLEILFSSGALHRLSSSVAAKMIKTIFE